MADKTAAVEAAEKHAESPVHAAPSSPQCELRMLAGPQAGARLSLADGHYRLGAGEECEVMLLGAGLAEISLELWIDGETLRLAAPETGWTADGRPVGEEANLPFASQLRLGEVLLTIDDLEAPWPVLLAPHDIAQRHSAAPVPLATLAQRRVPARRPLGWLVGTVATLASFCTWVWAAGGSIPVAADWSLSAQAAATPQSPAVRIDALVSKMGLAQQLTVGGSDDPEVSGCLPTQAALAQFLSALKTAGLHEVAVNVQTDDILLASLRAFLTSYDGQWTVKSVVCGVATVTGPADEQARTMLRDAAATAVALSRPIRFAALGSEEAASLMRGLLQKAELSKEIQVAVSPANDLALTGSFASSQRARLEQVFQEYLRQVGDAVKFSAQLSPSRAPAPPFTLKGVVGGSMPRVLAADGQMLYAGSEYEGYRVASIEPRRVVFTGPRTLEFTW